VNLMTSDLAGNLTTLDLDVAGLANVGGRLDGIERRVTDLAGALELDNRRASGGIAAAMEPWGRDEIWGHATIAMSARSLRE